MGTPLTAPVPNPAIPQPQQPRAWDAGSTGNTLLDLIQRLKEHADAADAAIADAHAHPSLQNDVGAFKDTVLGTLLGLPLEAAGTAGKMLTGAALSTLGNLTPHLNSDVPVLGGISDMAHQASDAPMRDDPFQDLLARNEAGASGHGFQVGLLNALLDPSNLLGGEGTGAHAFEAAATHIPTDPLAHAAALAARAGKDALPGDFIPQAIREIMATGKPLTDVLSTAMQATGKALPELTLQEKIAAIPADSMLRQQLIEQILPDAATIVGARRGNVARGNLLPGIGIDGRKGAGPLIPGGTPPAPTAAQALLTTPPAAATPAIDNAQAVLQMAVGQGATPSTADIQKALGVGMVEAGRLRDVASGAAVKGGDLVAPAGRTVSPETAALIDKVAPLDPAAPASTLDRMDALSGPPLRSLLNDLLTITYGSAAKKIVGNIAGAGVTFGPDARLVQNGEDVTRSMLDYLLQRDSLSPAERDALQARLFPASKVGQAAATAERAPGLTQAEARATMDRPDSADALDAMRQFILHGRGDNGMPALPNDPGFYTRNVPGVAGAEVPSLLKQLQQEGTLGFDARQGYMVKPSDTPGLTQATSVTDGAGNPIAQAMPQALDPRAAWQQNYVNQSRAGTDILAQGGKVAGSDVGQGAMNAMAPADRMAMLQKLAGGEPAAQAAAPLAADAPGTLGALPTSNYVTPLSAYTDRLFRESHADEVLAVLDPRRNGSGGNRELYFSNTPDLALGQGANKGGILVEYDPALVQGQVNMKMPGWEVAWQHGGTEFYSRSLDANSLNGAVRAVTIPAQMTLRPGEKIRLGRTLTGLEGQGWTREVLPDGRVRYTPPGVGEAQAATGMAPVGAVPAVPAAQTPALTTVEQVAAAAPEVRPQAVPPEQIIQHIDAGTVPPPEEVASIVADPTPPADLLKRHADNQAQTDLFSDAADGPPKGTPPRGIMGLLPQVTQAGTTASGATLGGIAGYQAGNGDGQDRLAGIGGAVAGAAIGAGLGNRAFTPEGAKTIQFFGAVGRQMLDAQTKALAVGVKDFSPKALANMWSTQNIQSAKNVFEELISNTIFMTKTDVPTSAALHNLVDLRDQFTAGARDAKNLVTTVARDIHTTTGNADYKANLGGQMDVQGGFHADTVYHPMASALVGAGLATMSPTSIATSALTGGVPVAGIAYGAVKEAFRPALTAAYEAFDGITKAAFRSAVYEDAAAKQLAADAAPFLQKVQQLTGSVPAALPQSGMFSADTIRTALAQAPAGVADALASEWALTSRQGLDTAAAFSRQIFGDFSNIHGAEKFIRSVVPFSSWVIRAIPRTVELVKDHPAIAAGVATQLIADGERATEEGRSSGQVGGIPIDSNTPVIGKLADMQTGGRGGVAHVNLLNGILPVPTSLFGGMGLDTSGQDAPVYDPSGKLIDQGSNQKKLQLFYMQFADAVQHAGFSVNPIIQAVAYAANWNFERPGSMSRDAGIEQALPGPRVGSAYAGLDFIRQQIGGGTVNDTTAGDKVLGQLFYDKYGMTMGDPRAAKLVAETMQPGNELVQQAESIANKAAISRSEISDVLPSSVQGQTGHELDIQRAQGDQSRTNQALIAQAQADPQGFQDFMAQLQQRQMQVQNLQRNYPVQYQQMLMQGAVPLKTANPAYGQLVAPTNVSPLLITQGTDTQHRAQQASVAWQQENQTLAYLAPSVYRAQLGALHSALGLPSQP